MAEWRGRAQLREATARIRPGRRIREGRVSPSRLLRGNSLQVSVLLEIGPVDLLHHTLRLWAQHREFRAVYAELSSRSDRELRDMGLERGDLARLAYQEAERRIVGPTASAAKASASAPHRPAFAPGR